MRILSCLVAGFVLAPPAALAADRAPELPATSRNEIVFGASTERAFDRSGKYVTTRTLADGSVTTELNGSFQNVTVARVGPGGVIETYCTTDSEDARSWMARENGSAAKVDVTGPATGDQR